MRECGRAGGRADGRAGRTGLRAERHQQGSVFVCASAQRVFTHRARMCMRAPRAQMCVGEPTAHVSACVRKVFSHAVGVSAHDRMNTRAHMHMHLHVVANAADVHRREVLLEWFMIEIPTKVMAYIIIAYIVVAYVVMAYIVMAYIVMAYIVKACVFMA